jgi:hypothetical protein
MASRNVQFYGSMNKALGGDPIQRDYAQDPRRLMAQQLMQQGSSTAPVQSPLEGLTRALSGVAGGYFGGQAQRDMQEREQALSSDISTAMEAATPRVVPATSATYDQSGIGDFEPGTPETTTKGGFAGIVDALRPMDNPDLSNFRQRALMGAMQQQQTLEAAELARTQAIAALKEQRAYNEVKAEKERLAAIELKGSPEGKTKPPKTVNTKEGVFILNNDGTLGTRLGSPNSQFGFELPSASSSNQPETTASRSNIPIARITPWDNIPLRDQGRAKIAARSDAQKTIETLRKSQGESSQLTRHAKRFQYLNTLTDTGGFADRLTNVSQDPSKREMSSIIDAATPLMRQGLPGAASEKDTAMFQSGFAGLNKTKKINDNITNAIILRSDNEKDYMNFLQEYLTQNGHLDQSDQYWRKYSEANPIFDKSAAAGSYTLNKDRKSYKEFFAPSPTLPEGITEEDIQQTMIEENVTRAQVLEFIGAK